MHSINNCICNVPIRPMNWHRHVLLPHHLQPPEDDGKSKSLISPPLLDCSFKKNVLGVFAWKSSSFAGAGFGIPHGTPLYRALLVTSTADDEVQHATFGTDIVDHCGPNASLIHFLQNKNRQTILYCAVQ